MIFNTIPEMMFEYLYSKENDAGKWLLRQYGWMLAEVFHINAIPQAVKPLVEAAFNHDFFTGRSIETPWEQDRLPPDRYRYYTSPTFIEIAKSMPKALDTVSEKIRSPLHLQNIYAEYTGTLGRYLTMATDGMIRHMNPDEYPSTPERMPADYPVTGRFVRGSNPRRTRYEEEFYKQFRMLLQVKNSLSFAEDFGSGAGDRRYEEIEKEYLPYIDTVQDFENMRGEVSKLNKEVMEIYRDPKMTPQQKRKEIDSIQLEKNRVFKEAHELRPSAQQTEARQENVQYLIQNFNASNRTDLETAAPVTAELVGDVMKLSESNLDRLRRSTGVPER
jgi:hypothetical protein